MEQKSKVLTPYALSIAHKAGWEIPAEVRERMIQGLQRFVEGGIQRRPTFAAVDLSLRKLAAVESLSRYTTLKPRVLGSITIEPNLWPASAVLDWWSVLYRLPGTRNQTSHLCQPVAYPLRPGQPQCQIQAREPLSTHFRSAVKTRNSQEMRDNWCIGYTRHYIVGVWVGNLSGEPMRNVSDVMGAAPIWGEISLPGCTAPRQAYRWRHRPGQ